jgi:hypothetical protein
MKLRFLSAVLTICLLLSLASVTLASNYPSIHTIRINQLQGIFANNNEKFDYYNKTFFNAKASDITIVCDDENVKFSASLVYDNKTVNFETEGAVYPVKLGGAYDGKLVLGDFKANNDLNVIYFGIGTKNRYLLKPNIHLKDATTLTLVLENNTTGDLIYYQGSVNDKCFCDLQEYSIKSLDALLKRNIFSNKDLKEKTVGLFFRLSKKLSEENSDVTKLDSSSKEVSLQTSVSIDKSGNSNLNTNKETSAFDTSVSYSELCRFLNDLARNGSVNPSNYSIPSTIYNSTGWSDAFNSNLFYFVKVGVLNGTGGEIATQLTLLDYKNGWTDTAEAYAQLEAKNGMLILYDPISKLVTCIVNDWGLYFKELRLNIGKLTGDTNIFVNRVIDGQLEGKPNYLRAAFALVPWLSTAADIWDYITPSKSQKIQEEYAFDSTPEIQKARNGGKLVKGIVADGTGYTFWLVGHRLYLKGKVGIFASDDTIYVTRGFRFTAQAHM